MCIEYFAYMYVLCTMYGLVPLEARSGCLTSLPPRVFKLYSSTVKIHSPLNCETLVVFWVSLSWIKLITFLSSH